MHSTRNTEIKVIDIASNNPASSQELEIDYSYDSYGWFHFINSPSKIAVLTDKNGSAVVPLSDFRYGTNIRINNGSWTTFPKQILREGGTFTVPFGSPVYRLEVAPLDKIHLAE